MNEDYDSNQHAIKWNSQASATLNILETQNALMTHSQNRILQTQVDHLLMKILTIRAKQIA
jgi:hypothetical protein